MLPERVHRFAGVFEWSSQARAVRRIRSVRELLSRAVAPGTDTRLAVLFDPRSSRPEPPTRRPNEAHTKTSEAHADAVELDQSPTVKLEESLTVRLESPTVKVEESPNAAELVESLTAVRLKKSATAAELVDSVTRPLEEVRTAGLVDTYADLDEGHVAELGLSVDEARTERIRLELALTSLHLPPSRKEHREAVPDARALEALAARVGSGRATWTLDLVSGSSSLRELVSARVEAASRSELKASSLEVLAYLEKHDLERLCDQHHVRGTRHSTHPNLVQLHYVQQGSNIEHRIAQECRGLILAKPQGPARKWHAVAYSFRKFFNVGDPRAHELEFAGARVTEKLDGSMAILYWYAGNWWVGSSRVPDGSVAIAHKLTFSELFFDVMRNVCGLRLPDEGLDHDEVRVARQCTFIFELVSPRLPVVVPPRREQVTLIGVRHLPTCLELDPRPVAIRFAWPSARVLSHFDSIDQVLDASRRLSPTTQEGFVITDRAFRRLKVKSPQYVALSHLNLKGPLNLNRGHMYEIIRIGEGAEFLAYFPEYAELYTQCLAEFEGLIATLLLAQAKPNQIRDADADVTAEIHKFAVNLREKHGSPLSERELRDQLLVLDPLVLRSLLPSSMDENPPDRNDPSATEGECRRSKKQRQRAKAERSRLRRERKNK